MKVIFPIYGFVAVGICLATTGPYSVANKTARSTEMVKQFGNHSDLPSRKPPTHVAEKQ